MCGTSSARRRTKRDEVVECILVPNGDILHPFVQSGGNISLALPEEFSSVWRGLLGNVRQSRTTAQILQDVPPLAGGWKIPAGRGRRNRTGRVIIIGGLECGITVEVAAIGADMLAISVTADVVVVIGFRPACCKPSSIPKRPHACLVAIFFTAMTRPWTLPSPPNFSFFLCTDTALVRLENDADDFSRLHRRFVRLFRNQIPRRTVIFRAVEVSDAGNARFGIGDVLYGFRRAVHLVSLVFPYDRMGRGRGDGKLPVPPS